ncbi:RNA polymerase factor sigma-70 [Azospirillum sp. ST 5-10]|uniref:RNA polymerase factor sigma-70 n=1 Tax=unclassified Azospirillum TaxID=2630922 RepID=UPI003F4A693C
MTQPGTADEHPLALIFATHRQSYISVAERITGSRSHAEDIVHDAFVKLISMPLSNSIRSQSGYLMKVVRNLAIDHYRRKLMELHLMTSEEEGHSVVSPEAASPESISRDRETLKTLDSALAELPERTRYAFEMHRIHGFSQKDIADSLGVSPTLVNFMIRDALVHCRKTLQDKHAAE